MMRIASLNQHTASQCHRLATITLGLSLLALALAFAFLAPAEGQVRPPTNAKSPPMEALENSVGRTQQGHCPWPKNRYLWFSNHTSLTIQVFANDAIIHVGKSRTIKLKQLSAFSSSDAKAVAGELGVPVGLVNRVLRFCTEHPDAGAEEVAQQLRASVIDFRFLLAELSAYRPPALGEGAYQAALMDLLHGDVARVWSYYRELPWPQAPTSLRIVDARQ
jgi:hypothetical protein